MEFDIFLLAALAFLLLVMISSGRRRKKQAQQLTDSLVVGAKVMTHAGIIGTIVEVLEDEVVVESGPKTRLRVVKQAIRTSKLPEVSGSETESQTTEPDPKSGIKDVVATKSVAAKSSTVKPAPGKAAGTTKPAPGKAAGTTKPAVAKPKAKPGTESK